MSSIVYVKLKTEVRVKAATPPEAETLADRIDAMLPRARITEVLHEVSRTTGFASAFTNLRTGEGVDDVRDFIVKQGLLGVPAESG